MRDQGFVCYSEGEEELVSEEETGYAIVEDDPDNPGFVYTDDTSDEETAEGTAFQVDSPHDDPDFVCRACRVPFATQAALDKHIDAFCSKRMAVRPRRVTEINFSATAPATPPAGYRFTEDQVIEANPVPGNGRLGGRKTSYFKIDVKADVTGEATSVCLDSGSSGLLVDRQWVSEWGKNPIFRKVAPRRMKAVDSRPVVDTEVDFDFYIEGRVKGNKVYGHFPVTANVIDNLPPKMLIGTNFLCEHGVNIDFTNATCRFHSVFGMVVRGEVLHRSVVIALRRRVTAREKVVIPPMSEAMINAKQEDFDEMATDNTPISSEKKGRPEVSESSKPLVGGAFQYGSSLKDLTIDLAIFHQFLKVSGVGSFACG
ncbi:hypothetical protein F4804DRAFT_349450 [Jackrogersella minutella]|nr:hypothetical protein F4804DRAFT_349450 [Jackrogersella minutella]